MSIATFPSDNRDQDSLGSSFLLEMTEDLVVGRFQSIELDCDSSNICQNSQEPKSSDPSLDSIKEKALLRKLDWHILPMLTILYMFSFVDRINIGNARIQGLEHDLGMQGNDFNIALFIFFVPYVLCEVPSNMLLKRIKPSTWLSLIMFFWGMMTVCQGLTQSYAGLVICRFLLGVFEAGFVPGSFYLISMYYKRHEMQWRFSLFFTGAVFAGVWAGLLAYGLASMAGVGGYNGWRWIFIVEGLLTIAVASVSKFFIADWPHEATFLSEEERNLLRLRLKQDTMDANMDRYDSKAARRIWKDWKMYIGAVMYFGVVNTGYSGSFFTPTILNELGWTAVRAQVMLIPIYAVATICTLTVAFLSDNLKHRYTFCMIGLLVATAGYALLLAQKMLPVSVRYFAVYLVICGGYITQPVVLAWLANNQAGHYKRAVSSAFQIGFGNIGGIVASTIYLSSQAPTYVIGYGVSLGLFWLCGLACTAFLIGLRQENQLRNKGRRDHRFQLQPEELANIGDDHPAFRFTY